jgi:hypothetical protein
MLREKDHNNDFFDAATRFQTAADGVVGQTFATRVDAAAALRTVVDPVVGRVYRESLYRWDRPINHHYPRENGRKLDFND